MPYTKRTGIPGSVGAWKYGQTVKTQTFRQPNHDISLSLSDARIQVSFFLYSELELRHSMMIFELTSRFKFLELPSRVCRRRFSKPLNLMVFDLLAC